MSEPKCECTTAGFCNRYKIQQTQYAHEVCQDKHGEAKGEAYRKKWREQIGIPPKVLLANQPQTLPHEATIPQEGKYIVVREKPRPLPTPIEEWPWLARMVARLRTDSDLGLGDTVERHLELLGAGGMKVAYKRITGKDCGCGDRKKKLNEMFPYPTDKEVAIQEILKVHKPIRWAYGITTVPERRTDLLPRTIASLKAGGFHEPRLFVDGVKDATPYIEQFNLPVTTHYPKVLTFGNWLLAIWELYLRDPNCHRYAIFQDDLICMKDLKHYLDVNPYPKHGYLNLYCFPQNEELRPTKDHVGFYLSNQMGRSAVALVFDRETIMALLASDHIAKRPTDPMRGWRSVDGAVVTALAKANIKEYVHYPSLTYHTGTKSVMGNEPYKESASFPGEGKSAMDLLIGKKESCLAPS
jgi:hypothetical protein